MSVEYDHNSVGGAEAVLDSRYIICIEEIDNRGKVKVIEELRELTPQEVARIVEADEGERTKVTVSMLGGIIQKEYPQWADILDGTSSAVRRIITLDVQDVQ